MFDAVPQVSFWVQISLFYAIFKRIQTLIVNIATFRLTAWGCWWQWQWWTEPPPFRSIARLSEALRTSRRHHLRFIQFKPLPFECTRLSQQWTRRPESLPQPEAIKMIKLSWKLDRIAFPKISKSNKYNKFVKIDLEPEIGEFTGLIWQRFLVQVESTVPVEAHQESANFRNNSCMDLTKLVER